MVTAEIDHLDTLSYGVKEDIQKRTPTGPITLLSEQDARKV